MFTKITMLSLILLILHIHPCLNLCIEEERRALLEIEKDMHSPSRFFSSWRKGGDCCNWQGITCHNTTGHVVGLDLSYNFVEAGSKLNPSLANLKHLTYLDLSGTNFNSSIPIFIGSLTRLEYLDLSLSEFGGTIPPQLGNLSKLKVLNMDDVFGFGLRVDDLHWLSRLTSLTLLLMNSVNLSTAIDWFDDINKLPYISTVSLQGCALSSIPVTVPPLNNFTFLQTFTLGGNELDSIIPSWLFNNISSLERLTLGFCGFYGGLPLLPRQVSKLKVLNLANNHLDGEVLLHLDRLPLLEELNLSYNNICSSISKVLWNLMHLTNITHLDLSANQIHGSLPKTLGNQNQFKTLTITSNNISGEIPHSIGNLSRLTALSLGNNSITGQIPHAIGNLSKLTYLRLRCNDMEGKIPDSIGNLEKLVRFDASTNHLSGEIPHSLFNLTKLEELNLTNNHFAGELPKSINLHYLSVVDLSNNGLHGPIFFSNQSSLMILDLSNNSFTGMLPFSGGITSQLQVVNLSNNRFSGTIPNLFMFHPSLESLQLNKNKLNGVIPSSLKYCKFLSFLDLSENNLHGKIPPWIGGTLRALHVLNLRSNNFVGQIPIELSYLTYLQILDLSHNHLNGNFSLYFGYFKMMKKAEKTRPAHFSVYIYIMYMRDDELGYNALEYLENIWLNNQGIPRQYTATIEYTVFIDISSNEISGEIPNGITKLVGLKALNLSKNHFVGNIPKDIGAIEDLESLDLSSNELSGEIPSTVAKLSHLSTLNLSCNKLSGMIPKGTQIQTFIDPSIYSGNSNLCGWPLPDCFGSNNNNTNFDDKENEEQEYWYEEAWINAGTVVGFLVSSWGIFITLVINNSVRRLYFYYVDKLNALISLQFHICISKIKSKIMKTEMR